MLLNFTYKLSLYLNIKARKMSNQSSLKVAIHILTKHSCLEPDCKIDSNLLMLNKLTLL